jgi:carboxyl-terminal processing protease
MQFDDEKDQGDSGSRPEGTAAGPDRDSDSEQEAAGGETAGTTSEAPAAAWTPPPSPWQPIQPSGWNAGTAQPQWGAPPSNPGQWPLPSGPSLWPPQPPTPPAWQSGPVWPPQQGWGAPPAPAYGPRRPSRLPAVITVAAACLLAFSGGLLTDHFGFPAASPAAQTSGSNQAQSDALYNEAVQIVKQNFVGRASLTDQQLQYGSISGLVNSLGDTGHSTFLTAAEYAQEQSSLNATAIAGIGVILSDDNGTFKITRVLSGTPAAAAGVLSGDQITAVDGTTTTNMTFEKMASMVRGTAGTKVTITVIHLGTSAPVDITMTRAKISVPLADWGMVPGTHVADIMLVEFSTGAADQVQADIAEAKAAGATSIILDLRGNPGGYANEAQEVASEFLPSGTVYIQQDAKGAETQYTVDAKRPHTTLPMVVLVDHDSASSAEIVTGALQDAGRAKIVGVNTFGTGTVLEPFKLSDGSVIILGTSWWLTPHGHKIFGVGITPDQKVQLQGTALPTDPAVLETMTVAQFSASTDAQLVAAVADLK